MPVRRAFWAGRRPSAGQIARAALLLGAPLLLIGVLAWPMLFTGAGFNEDWTRHLWFMWTQSLAISESHTPTFFINDVHSVFYPEYAFYGGTLYAVTGTLSLILGAPLATYILAYLLGFAASYGGWYWMARMAGLGRWQANAPGIVFITSAYYITLIYARGDLPEFTGVSMIPLFMASGLRVLSADRLRLWPALALVLSSVIFFGSHNLTLVWGSTLMALASIIAAICIPQARKWLTPRRVLRVAILVVPALMVNAWFLLPAIAYQSHTEISSSYPAWRQLLRADMYMVSARNLFTLSRASFILQGADFALSLPILAMAWAVLSILLLWRGRLRGTWPRVLLICVGLAILMTIVMTHAGIVLALPRPYAMLQYAYRLETYVMLPVSGAVLAALVVAQRSPGRLRLWTWALVPVLAIAVIGAIQQTDAYPIDTRVARNEVLKPPVKSGSWEENFGDYTDAYLPVAVDRQGRPAEVDFPAASVHDDHASKVVHLRPGQLVYTNIAGDPSLVHVTGARIVALNTEHDDVLEIGAGVRTPKTTRTGKRGSTWTEVISLSTAKGLPIVLGRILSLAAIIFLIGVFVVLAVRRLVSGGDDRAALDG